MKRRTRDRSASSTTADATPSKAFFVRMLVRDIELDDAILDLLDNCIDGVVRTLKKQNRPASAKPFEGFWAEITMSPDRFEIKDNCGGIPKKVARNKAFRLGRLPGDVADLPTVGMYGIGMKRAIFKMAEEAYVESLHPDSNFRVDITAEWLNDDDDWRLPLRPMRRGAIKNFGTVVAVTKLKPEIAQRFGSDSNFVDDFKAFVSAHYALIIEKGFKVKVNGDPIPAERFRLLISKDLPADEASAGLGPYCFKGSIDGVDIELLAGLYRELPDASEMETETSSRGSRDDAGWTVSCNDRVVVFRDKTRLTGWGDGGVPRYHGQFIAITGLVLLNSSKPERLPLTTTKRGLDASSNVYLVVREQMQLATRFFTSFTNRWKGRQEELEAIYKKAHLASMPQIRRALKDAEFKEVKKIAGATRFEPKLPAPPKSESDVRISFTRPRQNVEKLWRALFGSADCAPNELGETCFDRMYKEFVGKRV